MLKWELDTNKTMDLVSLGISTAVRASMLACAVERSAGALTDVTRKNPRGCVWRSRGTRHLSSCLDDQETGLGPLGVHLEGHRLHDGDVRWPARTGGILLVRGAEDWSSSAGTSLLAFRTLWARG